LASPSSNIGPVRGLRLFRQRTYWLPTWQGWLLIGLAVALLGAVATQCAMPFLAPTRPVQGSFLVVEGWLPDYGLDQAMQVFRHGGYRKLIVTGTEIEKGRHISVEKTYAQLAASTLRRAGFDEEQLVVLPSSKVERDRTYATALEVRRWLLANEPTAALDVFTMGPHARRTWVLYKLAIGKLNRVGIISFPSRDYDATRWWRSSQGFRETIDETVAYFYAKFFFDGKQPATPAD
jgi:hypothetical protein